MDSWQAQLESLRTYNLFYSAVWGEIGEGMVDIGFKVAGEYTHLFSQTQDVDTRPPFTLFDGDNVILFDILMPGTITDDVLEHVKSYNKINREVVEDHLRGLELPSGYTASDISGWDYCIVCRQQQYEDHLTGSDQEAKMIRRVEEISTLATISPGATLTIKNGKVTSRDLYDLLDRGICVPEKTASVVYLPRVVTDSLLAVGICEEIILGSDLSDGGESLRPADVRNEYGRPIAEDKIRGVLEMLCDHGICRRKDSGEVYLFTEYHIENIINVRDIVRRDGRNTTAEHKTLDEFTKDN